MIVRSAMITKMETKEVPKNPDESKSTINLNANKNKESKSTSNTSTSKGVVMMITQTSHLQAHGYCSWIDRC